MIQSKLLLVEGLPSTGKSTNSGILRTQLHQNGHAVRWIHEIARPHPTLFFHEACLTADEYHQFVVSHPHTKLLLDALAVHRGTFIAVDLLEIEWNHRETFGEDAYRDLAQYDVWNFPLQKYVDVALEKWKSFVDSQILQEEVIILDSSIFQFQIYTFLLEMAPMHVLQDFVKKIYDIIRPLNPVLIYLFRENVEDTIGYLIADRGQEFLERIWRRDCHLPYYRDKQADPVAYKQFLRDYDATLGQLVRTFPFVKIPLEISEAKWSEYMDTVLATLELSSMTPGIATPISGRYVNPGLGQEIAVEGDVLITPGGAHKKLIARRETNHFFLADLPMTIRFQDDALVVTGEQICERWTTSGTVFVRTSS